MQIVLLIILLLTGSTARQCYIDCPSITQRTDCLSTCCCSWCNTTTDCHDIPKAPSHTGTEEPTCPSSLEYCSERGDLFMKVVSILILICIILFVLIVIIYMIILCWCPLQLTFPHYSNIDLSQL